MIKPNYLLEHELIDIETQNLKYFTRQKAGFHSPLRLNDVYH